MVIYSSMSPGADPRGSIRTIAPQLHDLKKENLRILTKIKLFLKFKITCIRSVLSGLVSHTPPLIINVLDPRPCVVYIAVV